MPRWFITGAGGQLATAFSRLLEGEVFLSREETLDIRDAEAVTLRRPLVRPGLRAALRRVTRTWTAPRPTLRRAEAVNVLGTRNVVQAVRGTHTAVVYFSTDYVFDGEKSAPYVESDRTRPLNVYGRTKLAGEKEVLGWAHGIVFRTAWLFSETGHNFVKTILAAAQDRAGTGEPLRVVDDQVGSPTYAGHLAAAVDEALQRGISPGLYHLAGSGYCSWCELAGEIVDLAGLEVEVEPITTAEAGRPARRPAFSALDTERPIPRLPHWAEGVAEAVDRLVPLR